MKKTLSLIKACMSDNMSLFKIKSKNEKSKLVLPIVLYLILFFYMWSYANMLMEPLSEVNLEYVAITMFIAVTTLLTLVEGIYKSSNLLFNCKDDNMLLSLPISKSTVFFVRIFKFYVFELLYNSLFLVPSMVAYVRYAEVGIMYYIVSIIATLLLPIIPIAISCIIGTFISSSSSKFKHKNAIQIAITMVILVLVMYASFNLQSFLGNISEKADGINDIIVKIYYPAKLYINLITNFNSIDLLIFIVIHLGLALITVVALSKSYFKTNSRTKSIETHSNNKNYRVITNSPMKSLIKKELNRFINSPVFVINAAFGLVLFLIGCIYGCIKFEAIINGMIVEGEAGISIETVKNYIPAVLFVFICFASVMSSITSSMISLEGKSFNILKSLPISPFKIIMSKVLTAVLIMIPIFLIGDLIMFLRFEFSIMEILLIIVASVLLPFVAETIGIIVNLKYPKMDAENDTEVVKQSMSSGVAVFLGMILSGITALGTSVFIYYINSVVIGIAAVLGIYAIIFIALMSYLKMRGIKMFKTIEV